MLQAADLLAEQSLGLRVTAYGSERGITKNFNNYSEINDYLESIRQKTDGGALLSFGLNVGKEKLEEETSAVIASYKDYKIKDTLYKFVPSQNNDIFFGQDYFFMKGVFNQIKEIFRGN